VKRRVADHRVEKLVAPDDSFQYFFRRRLQPKLDGPGQARVRLHDPFRGTQRDGVDLGADEAPTVLAAPDDRIDAAGADADVENADRIAARDLAAAARREKIGDVMDVIGPAGDRRTERTLGQFPRRQSVEILEQRSVQRPDRRRIGEIDRRLAARRRDREGREFRTALRQLLEVVTSFMPISRMNKNTLRRE
jgi:hypothetical protein